jgi:hypothetical protein
MIGKYETKRVENADGHDLRALSPALHTGTRGAAADHEFVSFVPPFLHE